MQCDGVVVQSHKRRSNSCALQMSTSVEGPTALSESPCPTAALLQLQGRKLSSRTEGLTGLSSPFLWNLARYRWNFESTSLRAGYQTFRSTAVATLVSFMRLCCSPRRKESLSGGPGPWAAAVPHTCDHCAATAAAGLQQRESDAHRMQVLRTKGSFNRRTAPRPHCM